MAVAISIAHKNILTVTRIDVRSGFTPAVTAAAAANCVPINIGPSTANPYIPYLSKAFNALSSLAISADLPF